MRSEFDRLLRDPHDGRVGARPFVRPVDALRIHRHPARVRLRLRDRGVGVQVVGYGANTSYEYPAGLNLKLIAPPPITK